MKSKFHYLMFTFSLIGSSLIYGGTSDDFTEAIKSHKLFLGLMGAYPQEPVSTFGHVFLVASPNESEVPFLSWLTVNYAANLQEVDSVFKIYYEGIFGSIPAYYYYLPLYLKMREYAGEESREARFFPIKVTDVEYTRLENRINEIAGVQYPYNFFTRNCAHGLYELLSSTLDSMPAVEKKIMAPLDIVTILADHDRLGEPYIMHSLKDRIAEYTDKEHAELEYLEWLNSSKNAHRDEARENRLSTLRYNLSQKTINKKPLIVRDKPWRSPHGYSRVDIGAEYKEEQYFTNLRYRLLLHDVSDHHHFYSSELTLETLSASVSANLSEIHLREISFFHLRYAPIYDMLFKPLSYDFYTGHRDGATQLNIGIGISTGITNVVSFELLPTYSLRFADKTSNLLGFQAQINTRTDTDLRFGINHDHLFKISLQHFGNEKYVSLKTWLSYDLYKNLSLCIDHHIILKEKNTTSLSIRKNF